jgi:NADH-quinone oxidoreductase subunit H
MPVAIIILAVVALLVLGVIALITNIDSVVATLNNVLNWIFTPTSRVDPASVVVCKYDSACSTIHAFVYSAILLFVVITGFAYTTLLERRFIAWFQHRVGPNRVGPLGLLQPAADAVKLITKEDITPAGVDYPVWFIAPMLKAVPVLVVLAVIPLGPDLLIPWFDGRWYQVPLSLVDVNVGVLWVLAITSIGTYGIVLAGWSSNSKYSLLGGLRASSQMLSYELTLGLGMAVPIMIVGSMALGDIVRAQPMFWDWFVLQNPLAAGVLFIALLAEVTRAPFDLVEAEQELTAGFMTEYSGMKFALFMMAEYLGMIAISMVFSSLYLGGYQDGFGLVASVPILGPLVMIGKVVLLLIFMIWIRATLPRIRYDRLMQFGWKIMLPLALAAVCWTAVALVVGDAFPNPLAYGVAAGIFFGIVVIGGLIYLRRLSQTESPETADDLAADPIVTGERRGIGWALVNFVGTLIAIPFRLVNYIIGILENIARAGGVEVEADAPGSALALSEGTKAANRQVEALKAVARRQAPALEGGKAAPALAAQAAAPAPASGDAGGKAKFDKQAMLAKIREKKAQKG